MPKQSCSKRHYAWNLDYSLANLGYEPIYQKLQRRKLWGIFGFFFLERIGCEILFLLNLKDWNEKFQRLFCNTKIQWQNWAFFSIEDSKYFEFESNSSYRVEFIKNFRHNNCFHRKIFSITAMQKNTLTLKNFFPSLRSKIRKILNLILFFCISSNISKISKIIIIPV